MGFDPLSAGDASSDAAVASCVGLAPSCGPSGASECCDSRVVAGGSFLRGNDLGTDNAHTGTSDPATVSDFRLDTYEVTVGRFRSFVDAGMGTQGNPPLAGAGGRTLNGAASQGGWDPTWNASLAADTAALVAAVTCNSGSQSWSDIAGGPNDALPINCITWYEAFAFCVWDGGFLPTDAEWNYAAAGGSDQRAFAWSSPPSDLTIDCSHTNYYTGTVYCGGGAFGTVNRVGSDSPTGDGKYGQADLAGNVWEWTLDFFAGGYLNPCDDCANLTAAASNVLRGGGDTDMASSLRGAIRHAGTPAHRASDTGVRCARPL
jgi:formylglycine-generating enzyme required for sulfatase activity